MHKLANKLSQATLCSGDQGKFWEMRDRILMDQKTLKIEDVPKYTAELGLKEDLFQQCLDSGKYASHVATDTAEAQKAGVTSVPNFLLGFTEPDGKVRAVKMIKGAQPFQVFKETIDTMLNAGK